MRPEEGTESCIMLSIIILAWGLGTKRKKKGYGFTCLFDKLKKDRLVMVIIACQFDIHGKRKTQLSNASIKLTYGHKCGTFFWLLAGTECQSPGRQCYHWADGPDLKEKGN